MKFNLTFYQENDMLTEVETLRIRKQRDIQETLTELTAELETTPKEEHYKLGWLPHNLQYAIRLWGEETDRQKFEELVNQYGLDKNYFHIA